jgi:hypothetical protein
VTADLLAFDRLQGDLSRALAANRPGSGIDHVLIVLPSYSVNESILSHYGDRIASLEHRYLNALLIAGRIETCEIVSITTRAPDARVLDYYLALMPDRVRASAGERIHLVTIDDGTSRSVAAKLLDRPEVLGEIRERIGERPALIEGWNVTDAEVALALALGAPINGTSPALRGLGFKSEGRRLLRRAGVPVPRGVEDVQTADDVVAAVDVIRAARRDVRGVVVKHDDSGAGDGNVVIDLASMPQPDPGDDSLRHRIAQLPEWYLHDLARGGVVEERIAGDRFTSPSAQVDIRPGGEVVVLATHEQVLGGDSGQVYLGCRFPADPAYAPVIAQHAGAIGRELAERGAMGRFSVDFVAAASENGPWEVHALEINLRKGGTTHPYAALRSIVPGRYDATAGRWIAEDGSTRAYTATDNLVDPSWRGLEPGSVIDAVARAGLQFDPVTGLGVVLHMLSGLAIDGRMGLTAIAETSADADRLHDATRDAVHGLAMAAPRAT